MRLAFALLLTVCAAAPVGAQAPRAWTVAARQAAERFDDGRSAWLESELSVERRFAGGALIASGGRAERYDRGAAFGVLDGYAVLAPRLYGNARVRLAPGAETVARRDVLVELYRGLPGGVELSAGARRIDFATGGATLVLGSATLFRPAGRLRARVAATPTDSATAFSAGLTARLDLDRGPESARSFVEVRGGRGQEVVAEPDRPVDVRTSWDVGVGARARVGARAHVGAEVGRVWDGTLSRLTGGVHVRLDL